MTDNTVPDLLGALRRGAYPHDFIRRVTGPLTEEPGRQRAVALERLLDADEGGAAAFEGLLVLGARLVLTELHQYGQNEQAAVAVAYRHLSQASEAETEDLIALITGGSFSPLASLFSS